MLSRFLTLSVRRSLTTLTEDQLAIQQLARQFTKDHIIPNAAHHDQTGEYPVTILQEMWKCGLLNTHIPAAVGGADLGVLEGCLISEELAYGCSGIQTAAEANGLASAPLIVAGSQEQQKKFLGRLVEEPVMASYCVTEPGAGSDVASLQTKAVKHGNKWSITGTKQWITNGGYASWYFVLARTGTPAEGSRGLTGFIVDRQTPGITVGPKERNMGQRCSDTRQIIFEEVVVDDSCRLGDVGRGFVLAMQAFDITRPLIGAAATGVARRALDEAAKYALQRKTMGVPIAQHQAVQFMLADMATSIEASRLLVQRSASLYDAGQRNTFAASMAKVFASETANKCAADAVQILGGMGFNCEAPVEKLMRDAKIFMIYEGTSQIQRMIIARHLLEQYK